MSAQAEWNGRRCRVEHSDLAILAADSAFREGRREVGDAVVGRRNEIDSLVASSSLIPERIATPRIGFDGVEWTGTVRTDAMEYDPRTFHRVHSPQTGTHDRSRDFLRSGRESGLQKEQDRQLTY